MSALLDELLEMDDSPLTEARPADRRVVGTCRHVAVLSCALLRTALIPARARCGFATYFEAGKSLDHWIAEHWSEVERRWMRIDPEVLGLDVVAHPHDLAEGEFLTGGEAWQLCRKGLRDPMTFGVAGTDHAWGIAEIRGNALRDLAALNKIEMLPWDEWGPMKASYDGKTGPDLDAQLDVVAEACASDDLERIRALYGGFRVPEELIS